MSSDKDIEIEEPVYLKFADRPEWKDVTPIPQDDGPHPISPIAYSDEFQDKMGYFRAILKSQEKTARVLDLLGEIVKDNAGNYTVWYYRREVIKNLVKVNGGFDFESEMQLLNDMGESDPKNYQVWNHRRFIVENYYGKSQEREFLIGVLSEDAKNYHAWAHRQWLLKTYKEWNGELEYLESLLRLDHRNNSAWNHRYFVIYSLHYDAATKSFPTALLDKEIEYSLNYIRASPNNESPWSYLRGLFKGQKYSVRPQMKNTLLELQRKYIGCSHVNNLLIEIYQEENTKESLEKSLSICTVLSNNIDQIHHKYWEFKAKNITDQLEKLILNSQ